jgi:iron complex outermembrane recepter protein
VKKSFRTGMEISVGVRPWRFFDWNLNMTFSKNKILDFVEYYLDYKTTDWSSESKSRNHGTVDIAYSPSIIGSTDLTFIVPDNVKFHLISKYVGKQYFDNTMNTNRMIDPYFVNSVRIDYLPSIQKIKNAELQLYVNNLFNVKYESNAYGGNWYEDNVEKTWSYYFPQAGINFMLRLGVKF